MTELQQMKQVFSAEIVALSCGYIFFAANEIWTINWLDEIFGIDQPIFAALILNAYWPIQGYLYYIERAKSTTERIITPKMYWDYCILGSLAGMVSLTRCYGIVNLPPTLYVISANSELIWEALLTYFVLNRDLNKYHLTAVFMILFAICLSLYDPKTNTYGETNNVSTYQLTVGLSLSAISRFLSALNTILAER
jgi:drug/metabolite transporter (DMT)-like permease